MFDVAALRDACRALSSGSNTDQERGIAIQAWLDAAEARSSASTNSSNISSPTRASLARPCSTKKPATAFPAALQALMAEAERLCQILDRVKSAGVANATPPCSPGRSADRNLRRSSRPPRRLDYDDLILAAPAPADQGGRRPLGAVQAGWRARPYPDRRGAGHQPGAMASGAALAEEFFANAAAPTKSARCSRSATRSSRSTASSAPTPPSSPACAAISSPE